MNWEFVISILSLLILINYGILITSYFHGIGRLKASISSKIQPTYSVIIAARNEQDSIKKCLSGLALQTYPKDKFEIIIINDQSTDNTEFFINEFINQHPELNIRLLFTTGAGGKKVAIKKGIEEATSEYIIVTDSDCTHASGWVSEINNYFQSTDAVFVAGPVMMQPDESLFSKFQCLEFNSLLASTAGSIGINKPFMCNGANMAFSREAYFQLKANSMDERLASGDDVFLLFSMKERFGAERIAFARSRKSITFTSTNKTLGQFVQQRLRWASKSSSYTDPHAKHAAITVFSMNFALLFLMVCMLFNRELMIAWVTTFIIKTLIDTLVLLKYTSIFGQRSLLIYIPFAEPLIAIYTVLIGLAGNFISFKWKDRKIASINTQI